MDVDHEDIDEDIEQLNKVLQDEDDEEGEESEGELRSLELDGESYTDRDGSRPSTSTDVTSSFPTTSICTDPDDMSVRFDSSTINAESCLAMNRAYQEVLLDTLRQIEMSLAENRTKQSKLQQEVKDASRSSNYEKKMAGKGKRCTEQNIPYFRDKDGFYPPANEDVKIKQTLKEDKTYVKAKPGWSKTQRQTLISAVKEDAIQQLVRPLLSKLEVESEKANKCKNKEEIDASKTRIQHLYDEVNKKQKLSGKELLKLFDPDKIDFMKISATNMKGKYDATECEKMWRTVLQPGINKEKWSEDEDKKLEELVEKHNMRDWKAIAEELGTNRTPYQCLQHYQEEHFDYDQSPWTEAEDELLKEVVETCRYGSGVIPWPQVAYYIERRSTKMCEMRWSKVDPSLTHGRWTEAEDMALLAAVQLMGNACDWNVIKDFVPGRNAMQCRERFLKSLDSSVNFDHFTYTEDRIVLQSYNDLGAEWATIAGRLKGRTDCMVQTRHKRLMKWKAMYEEFMKLHKPLQRKILHPAFYIDKHNTIQLRNLPGFKKATPRTLISNTTKRRYKQTDEGAKNKQTDKGSKDLIGEARKLVEMGTEGYEEMKDAEDIKEEADDEYIKEEIVKEEEESVANEEIKALKQELQAFVDRTGIKVNDYAKLNRDIAEGGNSTVVWRPPPLSLSSERYFRQMVDKFSQLQVLVKRQALKEINKLYDSKEDLSAEDAQHLKVLGEMFSQDAADKGRLDQFTDRLYNLFGERLPAKMTVRELLDIARSKKLGIKRSQYIQDDDDPDLINDEEEEEEEKEEKEEDEDEDFDDIEAQELKEEELASLTKQPWEESDSEDEKRRKRRRVQDMESDSSDEEYFTKLEKEAQKREKERKLKAARRNYRGWSDEQKFKMKNAMSQHGELNRKIKAIIKRKMNQTGPGRKKKYIMYPMKIINQDKERTPEEWKKIDRKSFASFTKSLDVDSKVVFNKAYHTRRKITAMAMLKPMEKIKRTRSQSRQVPKIMGVLKEECNAADTLMDCQQELNIADEDLDGSSADSTAEQSTSTEPTNYDRSLPYIPPNKTTLLGMRQLLYEHKALIDNSKAYFNPQELKMQLYKLKTNGPNPLMNVLLAAGKDMEKNRAKTSVEQPSRKMKSSSQHVGQCQQTMREVRQTHDYQKLKARFQAVFTWPALMSTVAIPKVRTFPPAIIEKLKEPSYTEIFEEDPEMKEEPEDDDLTADADDVIPENAEDELDKNLPEIEAIEKLVEKIMEEYARTRSTRRKRIERKRPLKKNSNQKMGQQQRMKTMILRRLGLYERMKELQQAKVKSNSSNPKAGPSIDRTYKPHMRKTSLNSITDRTRTTRSKGGVDDDTSEKSQTEPADIKEMQTNPCEKSAGSAEGVNKSNDLQRPTEDVVEDMAIDDQVDDVNDDISECQTDKALELINGNAQKVISGSSQIAENIVPDSDLNSKVPQSIEESKTVADPEQLDITQTVEKECQNEVHQLKASDTTVKESKESQKIVNESITSQNNVNELNVSQIRICNPNTSKNESEDHEMDEEINKQHTAEEGCQANFEDSDDDDVTPQEKSTRSTEPLVEEVPKRRPGRQKGTKLKCYTPKESARKSSRHPVIPPTSDSKEAKKDGQDPAVKKKKRPSYQFSQSRIRAMIPGRFDKLVAQIPDVPIMSEAIPEPKTKTRKQRTRKPKQNEIVGNFKRKRVSAKMKKMLQSNYEMKCLKQAEKLTSLKEQQEQQELQKLIDNPKVPYLAIPILKEKDDNDEDMIDKTRKNIQEKLLKACMTAETNWGKSKYKGGKKQSYFFKPKGGQPRSKDTRLDKKRSNRNTSNMKITKRLVKNISILKSVNSKLSNQGETAQSKTWTSTNSTFPELNADGQEDFQQIEQPKTLSEYEPLLIDQPKTHLQNEPSQSDQPKTHLQNEPSQGDQPKTHLQNEPSQGDQPKTPNKIKKKKETLKKQKAIPVAYKGASAMGKEVCIKSTQNILKRKLAKSAIEEKRKLVQSAIEEKRKLAKSAIEEKVEEDYRIVKVERDNDDDDDDEEIPAKIAKTCENISNSDTSPIVRSETIEPSPSCQQQTINEQNSVHSPSCEVTSRALELPNQQQSTSTQIVSKPHQANSEIQSAAIGQVKLSTPSRINQSQAAANTATPQPAAALMNMQSMLGPMISMSLMQHQANSSEPRGTPLIVPVPVTVGNTQQFAFMPLFANSEGKYIMPDGKELEVGSPGNSVSLPAINLQQNQMTATAAHVNSGGDSGKTDSVSEKMA